MLDFNVNSSFNLNLGPDFVLNLRPNPNQNFAPCLYSNFELNLDPDRNPKLCNSRLNPCSYVDRESICDAAFISNLIPNFDQNLLPNVDPNLASCLDPIFFLMLIQILIQVTNVDPNVDPSYNYNLTSPFFRVRPAVAPTFPHGAARTKTATQSLWPPLCIALSPKRWLGSRRSSGSYCNHSRSSPMSFGLWWL